MKLMLVHNSLLQYMNRDNAVKVDVTGYTDSMMVVMVEDEFCTELMLRSTKVYLVEESEPHIRDRMLQAQNMVLNYKTSEMCRINEILRKVHI